MLDGMKTEPEYSLLLRSKSLTYMDVMINDCDADSTDPKVTFTYRE